MRKYKKLTHIKMKGDIKMTACAVKVNQPFVTSKPLSRGIGVSSEMRDRKEFIQNHNFSVKILDKNTLEYNVEITKR
jgi:hypothetical protein